MQCHLELLALSRNEEHLQRSRLSNAIFFPSLKLRVFSYWLRWHHRICRHKRFQKGSDVRDWRSLNRQSSLVQLKTLRNLKDCFCTSLNLLTQSCWLSMLAGKRVAVIVWISEYSSSRSILRVLHWLKVAQCGFIWSTRADFAWKLLF